jgi:hypothetical protein
MTRIVLLAVVVLAVAGCGRDADRTAVRTATGDFFAAVESGDGEQACAQLNPETRSALEDQEKSACRDAVTQLDLHGSPVQGVEVYEREAVGELRSGESVFLDQEADGWRVSAAGCTPVGDKPQDCQLES